MSQLKEQNGRYYQEAQVVMLATMNKSNLYCNKKSNILSLRKYQDKPLNDSIINQHLYITSNEEIKEGDWFIIDNKIHQCIGHYNHYICIKKDGSSILPINCKKIIATTNETLYLTFNNGKTDLKFVLPKPSDSFIFKYIEEYNKGNIISDVLVEYKLNQYKFMSTLCTTKEKEYALKVDSNNTITIKKIKTTYTQEEIDILIEKATSLLAKSYTKEQVKTLLQQLSKHLYNSGCTSYPEKIYNEITEQFINSKIK